ncbi:MAG: thioredoxin family protein [Planctomycetota bacterium]|nr:MAG: thioredoxin family protein [Planctomycetota bacterium]
MRTLLTSTLLLAAISPAVAQEDHSSKWFADFDQAAAAAKEAGKDLFVDFTGSDWCGWCIKLHKEVFDHDPFYALEKDFVFVALDYPRSEEAKAKVPNPDRNQELAKKYKIQGYPTILLMTAEGEVFGTTGYREGGPEKYVEFVKELTVSGKKALADVAQLKAEFEKAEDKAPIVRKACDLLENLASGAPGGSILAGIARQGLTLDPENKSGLQMAALRALLKSGQGEETDLAAAEKLDAKNAEGLMEYVIQAAMGKVRDETSANAMVDRLLAFKKLEKVHDKEMIQGMCVNAAYWCHSEKMLNRPEDAKVLAKWATELGEIHERMAPVIEQILGEDIS